MFMLQKSPVFYMESRLNTQLTVFKKNLCISALTCTLLCKHFCCYVSDVIGFNIIFTRGPMFFLSSYISQITGLVINFFSGWPLAKMAVTDIKWLRPFISNSSGARNISIPILGIRAIVGLNEVGGP